jgi:hypothetical protein
MMKGKVDSVLNEGLRHYRNIGEWRYSSTHSSPSCCVKASGELYAAAALASSADCEETGCAP